MEWSRRSVLGAGLVAAAAPFARAREGRAQAASDARSTPPKSFPFEEMTIRLMDEGLVAGRFTSRQICEAYLARIQEVDRKGPTPRSVIEGKPAALETADRLDKGRRATGDRGPLSGRHMHAT